MSDEGVTQVPTVFSSKERAALVAKALSEAARRARVSTKRQRALSGGGLRARRSERLLRLIWILSFVGIVLVPSIIASVYFGLIASDQYTAEARFTVRGGMPPSMDAIGAMTGAPPMLIIQDTQVIMNYIESRTILEELGKTIRLTQYYEKPNIDFFARLKQNQPIEKVLKYWRRQVDLSVQMPAGIVEMSVRAFSAQDAVTIARAVLDSSEKLVNQMNDQMRDDAVRLAETERERSQSNLAIARANLQKARNDEGVLSATEMSTALLQLKTEVSSSLIKLQQDYDSQRRFVNADAPQLRNLQSKIDSAQQEIAKVQAQMTGTKTSANGDKVLSGSMSRLDYALLNNDIADKIYAGSLAALERAKIASEMKLMYINTFVEPVLPQEAKYPLRGIDVTMVVLASLATWAAFLGVVHLIQRNAA